MSILNASWLNLLLGFAPHVKHAGTDDGSDHLGTLVVGTATLLASRTADTTQRAFFIHIVDISFLISMETGLW